MFNIEPENLKIGLPKKKVVFQPSFFRVYVKLPGRYWGPKGKWVFLSRHFSGAM